MSSRIYSKTNRIRFTDIPEKYAIPRGFRAKQCEVHSAIVTYVYEHFKDTKKYKQQIVDALNRLTFCVMQQEPPPFSWVPRDPIATMPDDIDLDVVESTIGTFYLTVEAIEWDVEPTHNMDDISAVSVPQSVEVKAEEQPKAKASKGEPKKKSAKTTESSTIINRPLRQVKEQKKLDISSPVTPTPKEDLYIQPPKYPRFDVSKIWISANVGNDNLVIYTTLPEIPTRQNEISVTTNLEMMTENELMSLYPNHVIHTRAPQMYEHYDGVEYDEDLGCIIPINGFTHDQLVDNIIRYPHLYRLRKIGPDGKLQPFFSNIEIDGELLPAGQIWDSLPESNLMPREPEFVKEYVIRRYLLEEENGIQHKYKMFGMLEPFLTLFMPCTKYIEKGYTDTFEIVKQCVTSRIHYKQSRNPILRRIESNNVQLHI